MTSTGESARSIGSTSRINPTPRVSVGSQRTSRSAIRPPSHPSPCPGGGKTPAESARRTAATIAASSSGMAVASSTSPRSRPSAVQWKLISEKRPLPSTVNARGAVSGGPLIRAQKGMEVAVGAEKC